MLSLGSICLTICLKITKSFKLARLCHEYCMGQFGFMSFIKLLHVKVKIIIREVVKVNEPSRILDNCIFMCKGQHYEAVEDKLRS